jgi:hypothetical protein
MNELSLSRRIYTTGQDISYILVGKYALYCNANRSSYLQLIWIGVIKVGTGLSSREP